MKVCARAGGHSALASLRGWWGARVLGIRAEFQPGSAGRQTERLLSKGRKDSPAPDPFSVNTG